MGTGKREQSQVIRENESGHPGQQQEKGNREVTLYSNYI